MVEEILKNLKKHNGNGNRTTISIVLDNVVGIAFVPFNYLLLIDDMVNGKIVNINVNDHDIRIIDG